MTHPWTFSLALAGVLALPRAARAADSAQRSTGAWWGITGTESFAAALAPLAALDNGGAVASGIGVGAPFVGIGIGVAASEHQWDYRPATAVQGGLWWMVTLGLTGALIDARDSGGTPLRLGDWAAGLGLAGAGAGATLGAFATDTEIKAAFLHGAPLAGAALGGLGAAVSYYGSSSELPQTARLRRGWIAAEIGLGAAMLGAAAVALFAPGPSAREASAAGAGGSGATSSRLTTAPAPPPIAVFSGTF